MKNVSCQSLSFPTACYILQTVRSGSASCEQTCNSIEVCPSQQPEGLWRGTRVNFGDWTAGVMPEHPTTSLMQLSVKMSVSFVPILSLSFLIEN